MHKKYVGIYVYAYIYIYTCTGIHDIHLNMSTRKAGFVASCYPPSCFQEDAKQMPG